MVIFGHLDGRGAEDWRIGGLWDSRAVVQGAVSLGRGVRRVLPLCHAYADKPWGGSAECYT
eukprot:454237-Prorocentrum_minimum.AAC.1